jgi:hypothetical protein
MKLMINIFRRNGLNYLLWFIHVALKVNKEIQGLGYMQLLIYLIMILCYH